jgi:L-amino acid N-acyltransferase YncA
MIRLATKRDMPFVRALAAHSLRYGIPEGRDVTPGEVAALIEKAYFGLETSYQPRADFMVLVAEDEGRLVGYIILDFTQVEAATGEKQTFIVDLAVERTHWGKGTTHRLIEKASELTRARGMKYLVGHVSANNTRTLGIAQDALGFTIERHQIVKRCD